MKRMTISAMMIATLLSGCTTAEEARRNLVFKAEGDNTVSGVADCISRQFKPTPDTFLSREPSDNGVSLKVMARVQFGMSVLHVVDIYRRDGKTILEASGPTKARDPEKDYKPYVDCLQAGAA